MPTLTCKQFQPIIELLSQNPKEYVVLGMKLEKEVLDLLESRKICYKVTSKGIVCALKENYMPSAQQIEVEFRRLKMVELARTEVLV